MQSSEMFRKTYPRLDEWKEVKQNGSEKYFAQIYQKDSISFKF